MSMTTSYYNGQLKQINSCVQVMSGPEYFILPQATPSKVL